MQKNATKADEDRALAAIGRAIAELEYIRDDIRLDLGSIYVRFDLSRHFISNWQYDIENVLHRLKEIHASYPRKDDK